MGKQAKREHKDGTGLKSAPLDEGLSPADKRFAGTLNYLARGIVIGGSLGIIAGWLIPGAEMGRMLGLGLLCGCLAGVTLKNRHDTRDGR
ncbi:MAG: hypothetical protein P4L39_08140 [Humidesulfovibrio sp.]|nr:hypothetical protein [Humidesulfovibrio sp.]